MMTPLKLKVAIIQYLDLDLILPPDSINESSNIVATLKLEVSYVLQTPQILILFPEWRGVSEKFEKVSGLH